jgi:hypothetical protein
MAHYTDVVIQASIPLHAHTNSLRAYTASVALRAYTARALACAHLTPLRALRAHTVVSPLMRATPYIDARPHVSTENAASDHGNGCSHGS